MLFWINGNGVSGPRDYDGDHAPARTVNRGAAPDYEARVVAAIDAGRRPAPPDPELVDAILADVRADRTPDVAALRLRIEARRLQRTKLTEAASRGPRVRPKTGS